MASEDKPKATPESETGNNDDKPKIFGTFLCMRFAATKLKEVEEYLRTQNPKSHGGRVEALSDQISDVEGKTWDRTKALGILYFPDRPQAKSWFAAATDLHGSEWLGDVDAVVVNLCAFPPKETHVAFSFAIMRLFDEKRFFTWYIPKWGPKFRKSGAALGASGREITREWEMLRGEWLEGEEALLVNYLPSVEAAMGFYHSEDYENAKKDRSSVGHIDIVALDRVVDMFAEEK